MVVFPEGCTGRHRTRLLRRDECRQRRFGGTGRHVEADGRDWRRFCRDDRCYHVIGDLIAYRDHGHLTTAYARTLTPDVEPAVDEALALRPS